VVIQVDSRDRKKISAITFSHAVFAFREKEQNRGDAEEVQSGFANGKRVSSE